MDIKDARAAIKLWIEEIGNQVGIKVSGQIINDIRDVTQKINSGHLDMAVTPTLDYLYFKDEINAEIFFSGIYHNNKSRKYVTIVHSENKQAPIVNTQGGILAVIEHDTLSRLFLDTLLLRSNLQMADIFYSSILKKKKASQAVLSVFFKRADICVVPNSVYETMTELNPQVARKLKVVASSPTMLDTVGILRKGYDQSWKAPLTKSALELHRTTRGKQILLLFKMDRLIRSTPADLRSVQALIDEYEALLDSH
jgi:ABC-type phosphate/phosphonate transport system substrate-binding protein